MVVAPPTIRDDGAYTWVNEGTAIAEAPAWLINLVTARPKANGSDATNAFEAYGEQAPKLGPRLTRDDAIAVLEDMQHGTIHASQLKATAILFNNGVGDDEIVETILRSERELSDTDGWDWGEEERTIRADLAEQHKERKAKEKVAEAKVAEAKVVRFADVVDLEDVTAQNLDYIWPNRTAIRKNIPASPAPAAAANRSCCMTWRHAFRMALSGLPTKARLARKRVDPQRRG